jgi:hypothetical protein
MKNHSQYIPVIVDLFDSFLRKNSPYHEFDGKRLIKELKRIEKSVRKEEPLKRKDWGLWFRFHENDTLATTINNIETTLTSTNKNNYDHLIECFYIAVKNPDGIKVYFS